MVKNKRLICAIILSLFLIIAEIAAFVWLVLDIKNESYLYPVLDLSYKASGIVLAAVLTIIFDYIILCTVFIAKGVASRVVLSVVILFSFLLCLVVCPICFVGVWSSATDDVNDYMKLDKRAETLLNDNIGSDVFDYEVIEVAEYRYSYRNDFDERLYMSFTVQLQSNDYQDWMEKIRLKDNASFEDQSEKQGYDGKIVFDAPRYGNASSDEGMICEIFYSDSQAKLCFDISYIADMM